MIELESFQSEIGSFLSNEKFNIFPFKKANFSDFLSELEWSDSENWEEFFSIAKNEGVSTIFEEIGMFTQTDLESFKKTDNSNNKKFENICADFKANIGELNSISFSWIKNNIRHTISKQSPWVDALLGKIEELKNQRDFDSFEEDDIPTYQDRSEEDIPEKLVGKEEELAEKLLEHIEVEHPNADRSEMWAIKQEFWDKIGINNYSNKQRVFTNKISTIADRIIGQKEREMIPDLIEKCVEWAMDNKIDKPTQAILRGFLAEDNINLTLNNFKILHTKVTIKLKSSK